MMALLTVVPAQAQTATIVRLAWDANSEPDLAGYRIRYGTTSGSRTQMIDVGNVTSYAISGLTAGTTYYFALHAYDLAGNESLPSNEIAAAPVVLAPALAIAAADAPDPVAAGANLAYTLSYANSGGANATGVMITDTVPANTMFVSATGGGTLSGSVVTWSLGTLNAGASGSVQVVVNVANPLTGGTVITNGSCAIDSNETPALSGTPVTTTVIAAAPTVSAAIESATNSIYILRSGTHNIRVTGSNFQSGAVVNLSADITAGATALTSSAALDVAIQVAAAATLGPRALTLTNPDGGTARLASALTVVKSPDLNGDCLVDGTDLNLIARAWNTTSGQAAYNAAADLDGDNYVGPIDLTIFTKYFGHRLAGCP